MFEGLLEMRSQMLFPTRTDYYQIAWCSNGVRVASSVLGCCEAYALATHMVMVRALSCWLRTGIYSGGKGCFAFERGLCETQ